MREAAVMTKLRRQRGGTLLEACFALMILFAFTIGVLDFGRGYNVYQIATNAAREGARYAVAPQIGTMTLPSSDAVKAQAQTYLDSGNVPCPDSSCISVSSVDQTFNGHTMTYTTVTVQVPYQLIAAQMLGLPASTALNLKTAATMRNETN
jgi:Flp pilus assembly protein TadG